MLAVRAQPVCTENKLIGSKLIFKGMVELYLLLQETGGGLSASHESLPFSQIIEVTGAGEEGDCQVEVEVASLQCEQSSGDSRALDVTLEPTAPVPPEAALTAPPAGTEAGSPVPPL